MINNNVRLKGNIVQYDINGRIRKIQKLNGTVFEYEYDRFGRIIKIYKNNILIIEYHTN